jgi:hypothetical protein
MTNNINRQKNWKSSFDITFCLFEFLIEPWQIFSFNFKGAPSQEEQKTNLRRLMIYKVTLTGQSDFKQIFDSVKLKMR